jgi:predicted SnoaL-like aldol condensation-catalyzing enzyme
MASLEQNKKNAIAFYETMFNKAEPMEAVRLYVGKDYIQHNPGVEDGKDGFIRYFTKMAKEHPGKSVQIRRAVAEGNFVVLHCYQKWPGGKDYATIDIFRFDDDGKIAEHWDVIQLIPKKSQNENTMF